MGLETVKDDIYRCFRCGYCREMVRYQTNTYKVCPIREELRFEHYDCRGRILIAKAILEGNLDYNDKLVETVYTDLGCGLCKEVCPMFDWAKVDLPRVIKAWREEIVQKGLGPPQVLKEINEYTRKCGNPFGKSQNEMTKWRARSVIPTKGEVLYFAGCYSSYRQPKIAKSTINVLTKTETDFAIMNEERCCGTPQIWNGQTDLATELAMKNVKAIEETGARKVLTTCPGCYMAFKDDYPRFVNVNFEPYHMTQFLADLVDQRAIEFMSLKKTVTYHDPCHLGRFARIFEQPRKVIENIPGVKFVEMLRNKENAWCCGSGVVVAPTFPDLSLRIAEKRVQEAVETGAEILVTACPSCVTQLDIAAKRSKAKLEVLDLVELAERQLAK